MDVTTVVVILVVVLVLGGIGGLLLRDFGRQVLERDAEIALQALGARDEAEVERLRGELRALATEYAAQLTRLRERGIELEALAAESRERLALAPGHNGAGAARVRPPEPGESADSRATADGGTDPLREQRAEVLAELYRRLARVEATLAALTNPILLPGEPYAVPAEFLPETLKWENWKEVGEAAFAFGDYANGHRLHLTEATVGAVGGCVTTLRTALTRSIYPNLAPSPTPEQEETLRAGLAEIAAALPRLRRRLEADYRSLAGIEATRTGTPTQATS